MRNILVPKLYGFAKNFRFSYFEPVTSVHLYCLFNVTSSTENLMASLVSLMTLNHFETSYMILTKLGTFYLVSLKLACSDVCCQRTELEIS